MFGIATLACVTIEEGTIGADSGLWQNLFDVEGLEFSNPITAVYSVLVFAWGLISDLLGILFFQYDSIFYGDWIWFRTIFLYPISVAMIIAFTLAVRGTSSG